MIQLQMFHFPALGLQSTHLMKHLQYYIMIRNFEQKKLECHRIWFNTSANNKILFLSKFKAFTDNKLNVAGMIEFIERVENIAEKGKRCWLPVFPPFPIMFSKRFSHMVLQHRIDTNGTI